MAGIASSSAMTFNLLGNGPVIIPSDFKVPCTGDRLPLIIPAGEYTVIFEKQMYTVNAGSKPANLDAFLYNEKTKAAVFCEMKMFEWLSSPRGLKDAYCDKSSYFDPEPDAVGFAADTFCVFESLTDKIKLHSKSDPNKAGHKLFVSRYSVYDAWQMLKHTLAIYNYTSFVTRSSVNAFKGGNIPSLAGRFDKIVLLNVVNEMPPEWIADEEIRENILYGKNWKNCRQLILFI